jgi:hypothetical protein
VHPHIAMCPTALDLASYLRWALVLPCVLWLRTSPPSRGGLQCCHVSYGSGPRLPTELGSSAAICPIALDLASQLMWALTLPYILWLWTSPHSWGGLHRCNMSYGSGPRLPAEVGSGAATCPMAPNLASRLRWTAALPRVPRVPVDREFQV